MRKVKWTAVRSVALTNVMRISSKVWVISHDQSTCVILAVASEAQVNKRGFAAAINRATDRHSALDDN